MKMRQPHQNVGMNSWGKLPAHLANEITPQIKHLQNMWFHFSFHMNYVPTKKVYHRRIHILIMFFLSREHTGVCVMVGQTVVSSMQLIKTYGPKAYIIYHSKLVLPPMVLACQRCWHQHQIAKYNGQERIILSMDSIPIYVFMQCKAKNITIS